MKCNCLTIFVVASAAALAAATTPSSGEADRVSSLPGLRGPLLEENFAGYIPVNNATANLFYTFSTARNATAAEVPTPLVMFINGGPGASSLTGSLTENGPYTLEDHGSLVPNLNSWNQHFHLVYVDQPAGTGFSYCSDGTDACLVTSLDEAAEQLAEFLATFMFERHPPLVSDSPLFLTGESFAGKFIPFTAAHILGGSAAATSSSSSSSKLAAALKRGGLMIGNPEMDTLLQYPLTLDYLRGQGMLGPHQVKQLQAKFDAPTKGCKALVQSSLQGGPIAKEIWIQASAVCEAWLNSLYPLAGNPFRYDIRDPNGAFKALTARLESYLSRADVGKALHTRGKRWKSGDGEAVPNKVAEALVAAIEKPGAIAKLASVLTAGVHAMVYDGSMDGSPFNHLSVEACMESMEWSGSSVFASADHEPVFLLPAPQQQQQEEQEQEQVSGFARKAGLFTYFVVARAGHLVPMDRPRVSAAMLQKFVEGAVAAAASAGNAVV